MTHTHRNAAVCTAGCPAIIQISSEPLLTKLPHCVSLECGHCTRILFCRKKENRPRPLATIATLPKWPKRIVAIARQSKMQVDVLGTVATTRRRRTVEAARRPGVAEDSPVVLPAGLAWYQKPTFALSDYIIFVKKRMAPCRGGRHRCRLHHGCKLRLCLSVGAHRGRLRCAVLSHLAGCRYTFATGGFRGHSRCCDLNHGV